MCSPNVPINDCTNQWYYQKQHKSFPWNCLLILSKKQWFWNTTELFNTEIKKVSRFDSAAGDLCKKDDQTVFLAGHNGDININFKRLFKLSFMGCFIEDKNCCYWFILN